MSFHSRQSFSVSFFHVSLGLPGQYPILIQILANMFKYLIHLKMSKNTLLKEAYDLSENLSEKGIDSWVNFIESILTYFNIKADIKSDCKHLI